MRLIDADKLDYTCNADECSRLAGCIHCQYSIITEDEIESAQTVEAIPKSNYEARLKADMVAMLQDLDLQIDESAAYNLEVAKVQRLIRDKINVLKGGTRWQ